MDATIGIVGSGAVAQALGRLLRDAGQNVVAVASRTPSSAARAAAFIGPSVRAVTAEDLPGLAARIVVATSDAGVAPTARTLARAGFVAGVALHTCGSLGPDALAPLQEGGVACGVLHPLQTFATPEAGRGSLRGITFGLAGDADALAWGREIIALLGGREFPIGAGRMAAYHAGATMAGNVLIAVVDAAIRMLTAAGFDGPAALEAIGPLCRTSLDNALRLGPEAALTGPVARGDAGTVARHLSALEVAPPDVVALYRAGAYCLLDIARRRGLAHESRLAVAAALEATLEEPR